MEAKFAQQLKKGVLDMLVLKLVMEKDTYGYEILQTLKQRGGMFFDLKEGTLYPVLYRLEDNGFILSSWKTEEGRNTPKKYYSITHEGREKYSEYWSTWIEFENSIFKVCEEE